MPKQFLPPDAEAAWLLKVARKKWHGELEHARIVLVMVYRDTCECALRWRGRRAYGVARVASAVERAAGKYDGVIQVDGDAWPKMTPEQRLWLLDHELEHFVVGRVISEDGRLNQVELSLRKHDIVFEGFGDVIRRHGTNALELVELLAVRQENQGVFEFMEGIAKDLDGGGEPSRILKLAAGSDQHSAISGQPEVSACSEKS